MAQILPEVKLEPQPDDIVDETAPIMVEASPEAPDLPLPDVPSEEDKKLADRVCTFSESLLLKAFYEINYLAKYFNTVQECRYLEKTNKIHYMDFRTKFYSMLERQIPKGFDQIFVKLAQCLEFAVDHITLEEQLDLLLTVEAQMTKSKAVEREDKWVELYIKKVVKTAVYYGRATSMDKKEMLQAHGFYPGWYGTGYGRALGESELQSGYMSIAPMAWGEWITLWMLNMEKADQHIHPNWKKLSNSKKKEYLVTLFKTMNKNYKFED